MRRADIPAGFVVIDFIRTTRSVRRPSMVTPDMPWPDPPHGRVMHPVNIEKEFISEEEFKV